MNDTILCSWPFTASPEKKKWDKMQQCEATQGNINHRNTNNSTGTCHSQDAGTYAAPDISCKYFLASSTVIETAE